MIMRLFTFFMILFFGLNASATPERIVMSDPNQQPDHIQYYIPADQPDVYLDIDNFTIIIDGGEVAYYDVEIESMTTWLTVISTQVSGTCDTIDVSSLATGDYIITITSPTGNEFEGYFEIE